MTSSREKIRELVTSSNLEAHAAMIEGLIQPSIRIVATAIARRPEGFRRSVDQQPDEAKLEEMERALSDLRPGASRFGGVPDLPPGTEWPDRDGVPMEFIAQIRLADLADPRLPS